MAHPKAFAIAERLNYKRYAGKPPYIRNYLHDLYAFGKGSFFHLTKIIKHIASVL